MEKQEEEALIKRILRKTRLFGDGKPQAKTVEEVERDIPELKKEKSALATQKAERDRDRISLERHESILTKPRDRMGRDEFHPDYSGPSSVRERLKASYSVKAKDGMVSGIGINIAETLTMMNDPNDITTPGTYGIYPGSPNMPTGFSCKVEHYISDGGSLNQRCMQLEGHQGWVRRRVGSSAWSSWIHCGGLISADHNIEINAHSVDDAKINPALISGAMIKEIASAYALDPSMTKAQVRLEAKAVAEEKKRSGNEDVLEDRFMDVILDELNKFGPDTGEDVNVTAVFGRVLTSMKELAALSGTSLDNILEKLEMTEEKSPKIVALEELAAQMTSYWQDPEFALEPQHFDLNTPKSLTVWKGDKGAYSKHSHIGGESFVPVKAHVGKRGHIILTFNAVTTEPYSWMEMPLTDSLVDLSKFQSHFINAGFVTKWSEIANAEQTARQAAELAKHGDKYADFGSY